MRTPIYAELDMAKMRRIRRRARVAYDAPRPGGRRRTDPPLTPASPG